MAKPWDHVVVGGGIVGVATARELCVRSPGTRVLLLDKEKRLAAHQSGHNSGVIHSGIYYPPGTLKAELCRAGARLTEHYAERHGVPWRRTGKLLVATHDRELARLGNLAERARHHQIPSEELCAAELREREPALTGVGALLLHSTGITDYRALTEAMAREVQTSGGEVRLGTEVLGLRESAGAVVVETDRGELEAERVVVCGGIQADRLAALGAMLMQHRRHAAT